MLELMFSFSITFNFSRFLFSFGRYLRFCFSIKHKKHKQFSIMKVSISVQFKGISSSIASQTEASRHPLLLGCNFPFHLVGFYSVR